MKKHLPTALSGVIATTAVIGGDLSLTIEIPRLDVAEYHRPYVAAWIERPDRTVAANLAVWYDTEMRNDEGETWLKDLRQWWRRTGRSLDMPVDGVSGPTRPPGKHALTFSTSDEALKALADGEYNVVVEAAREVGGREMLRIPFTLGKTSSTAISGETELGQIEFSIN
jgi:hypothetical protein